MQYLGWTDDWFQRWFPPLLVLQLVVILAWVITGALPGPGAAPVADAAPATLASSATDVTAAAPQPKPKPADQLIRDGRGIVGKVNIGMTRDAVSAKLDEDLVVVQEAPRATRRFEVVAPRAGLRLSGTGTTVDTITVVNSGEGQTYRTSKGIKIGHTSRSVPRAYGYARLVCRKEWWAKRGNYTLRIAVQGRVSSITVTSRKAPQFVDCF